MLAPSRVRLYAHRGAAAEFPENTLPSFQRAMEVGADALEMDVHMTADRHVVVSHDPDGQRMTGVVKEIRATPLSELKTWDAGHGFVDSDGARPFAGQGIAIPTLAEILEEFPDTPINIDLKQTSPNMVEEVLAVIRDHGAHDRVLIASFYLRNLIGVRRRHYPGQTALAPAEVLAARFAPKALVRRLPWRGQAAQIPPSQSGLTFATEAVIQRLHDLGLRVDFWTINDPQEAIGLINLGADGIMTDDPAAIAPAIGKVSNT